MGWTSAESGNETWAAGYSEDYTPVVYYEVKNPKKYQSKYVEYWDNDVVKNLENRIFEDYFDTFDLSIKELEPEDYPLVADFFNNKNLTELSPQHKTLLAKLGCDAKNFTFPDVDKLAQTEKFSYLRGSKDIVKKEINFASMLQNYAKWELSRVILEDSSQALDLRLYCMKHYNGSYSHPSYGGKVYFNKMPMSWNSSNIPLYKDPKNVRKFADYLLSTDSSFRDYERWKILDAYSPQEAVKFFRHKDFQCNLNDIVHFKSSYIKEALPEIPTKELKDFLNVGVSDGRTHWIRSIDFNDDGEPKTDKDRNYLELLTAIYQKVGYFSSYNLEYAKHEDKIKLYLIKNGFAKDIANEDSRRRNYDREDVLNKYGESSYSMLNYFDLIQKDPEKAQKLISKGFDIPDTELRHNIIDRFSREFYFSKNEQALQYVKEILKYHPLEKDASIDNETKGVLAVEGLVAKEDVKWNEITSCSLEDLLEKAYKKGLFKASAQKNKDFHRILPYYDINERWKDNRGGLTNLLDYKLSKNQIDNVADLLNRGADINMTVERVNKEGKKFPTKAFIRYIDGQLYFKKENLLRDMMIGITKKLDKDKLGLMAKIFGSLPYKTQENAALKEIKKEVMDLVAERRAEAQTSNEKDIETKKQELIQKKNEYQQQKVQKLVSSSSANKVENEKTILEKNLRNEKETLQPQKVSGNIIDLVIKNNKQNI